MHYSESKRNSEKRLQKSKSIASTCFMLLLLFLIMLGIICWGYFFQNNGWVIHNVSETFTQAGDFDLTMHILDVEQGECILVESDGEAMIIDAGSDDV